MEGGPGTAGITASPGTGGEQNQQVPPPGPGGEKGSDGTPKPSEFFIIEGMGKVTPEDVKAIGAAKSGLEKTVRTQKREIADLREGKPPEPPAPKPGDPPKGTPDPALEELRKTIAADRNELIREKIKLRLEAKGIKIDPKFLNIKVEKLSDVDDAVQGFIDENETLVSLFANEKGNPNPGNEPQGPKPPGRTNTPGNPPPAPDKEAEIRSKFDKAAATGDQKLWDQANAELAEFRGEKVEGGRGPAI